MKPRIDAAELVQNTAEPLSGDNTDYNSLLELIGDARLVLIG